jgi:hypothetical protein
MATINLEPARAYEPAYDDSHDHNSWNEAFDPQTRHDLIEDDLAAGRSVCAVLISIVVGGLLLGIVAVLLAI